jgi:HlyD family secretion protein
VQLVSFKPKADAPVSGGEMDKAVARAGLTPKLRLTLGAVAFLVLAFGTYFMAPARNSQAVETTRLTVSTVSAGQFEDFLPLRGRVTPSVTVFLDAVEGGRVERILVEDGAVVQQGQMLAILSNSDLQLNVLARQTEVTQQINSMRSQELALSQTRLANERALIEAELAAQTARRQYEVQRPLADRGFVAGRAVADSRDTMTAAQRRSAVLARQRSTDERLQSAQLAQLRASASSLNTSLDLARASLDALNLRAPVSGQLTSFSIQVGQSLQRGRAARADRQRPGATSWSRRSTNSISAASPRGRRRRRRSAASRSSCAWPRFTPKFRTAPSRSTSPSRRASPPSCSAARQCRSA